MITRGYLGRFDPRLPSPAPDPNHPTDIGQMLMSLDGETWESVRPVVSGADGWLSNADGDLLIEGMVP